MKHSSSTGSFAACEDLPGCVCLSSNVNSDSSASPSTVENGVGTVVNAGKSSLVVRSCKNVDESGNCRR